MSQSTDAEDASYESRTDLAVFEDQGYQKSLGNRQVQMIAIGGAIGSGLFLSAGARLHSAGPSLMIAYAVGGLFAFLVVRAMGEMEYAGRWWIGPGGRPLDKIWWPEV